MIDIPKLYLEIIIHVFDKHLPDCEIRAFGSRVKGTAKSYSDLDLVIVGKEKIPFQILHHLKEDLENSEIPFRVDVIDWYRISDAFKRVIDEHYEKLN